MPTRLRGPQGQTIEVPEGESIGHYVDRGFEVLSAGDEYAALKAEAAKPVDRGALGTINAGATSLLSGATLGLSDVVLSSLSTGEERRQLFEDRAANPLVSAGANIIGTIAPALAAPGTLLGSAPAGIVGRASAAGFEAGRAAGGLAGVAQAAGATAVEGALQSAGAYLADTALADRKLSAEGALAAIGLGATFGGAAGGALLGIERGTIAARRMFARTANADKAAAEAEAAWTAAHQSTIEANDTAAEVAKAKLAQARVAREQADLAKQQAVAFEADVRSAATDIDAYRQQFAGDIAAREQQLQRLALPAGPDIALAAPGPAKLQELAEAVAEHDAARIDLDDLLRRLDAPDIEPGVASPVTVPRGQFDDLSQRGPLAQGTPVDVTTVGKKLGEGTPTGFETTAFDSRDLGLRFDPKTRTYHGEPIAPREAAPPETATGVFRKPSGIEESVPAPTNPEPIAPGKTIAELKHPDETAENFVLRRMRTQGEAFGDPEFNRAMGESKVFLGSLGIDWTVPENKAVMLKMLRNGDAQFARADLVGAMDPSMVKASEIAMKGPGGFGDESWHFIKDTGQPVQMPKAAPAPADDLLSALRSNEAALSSGADLGKLSRKSPAAADYATKKLAKREADAQFFRDKNTKPTGLEGALDAQRIVSQDVAADDFFASLTRPRSRDQYVAQNIGRAMREEGSHAAALAKVEREWAEIAAADAWAERAAILEYDGGYSRVEAERLAREEMDNVPIGLGSWSGRPNAKRVEAARKAAAVSVERRREIHSAVASNLPPELRTAWDHEGHGFMQREAGRIRGVKDRISASSKLSEAFTEQYGSASETLRGYEGDRFFRRAEIEAKHAESWADEQERKYYARAAREHEVADDVTSAANVITKYERAAAKLTEALGPEAPPAAQQAAKAFRDAEATVDRKTLDRATRAIDDHAEPQRPKGIKGGPTLGRSTQQPVFGDVPLPPSSREMLDAARSRKLDADAELKRARVAETEAKIGARQAQDTADATRAAADAVRPVPPAPAGESRLGGLAAAAGVADFADILGIPGIPQPSDIPIIGPLLGVYLKFKALKYAAGRFTGRVAATGDTKAAALAARTKERMAEAVDRTLGLVEKATPKARAAAVAATTQLNRRLFDDGEPDAPKNASVQELAAVRIREITAAVTRPDLVAKQVAREFRGVTDPDLIAEIEKHLFERFVYLNRVSPKAPPPNPFSKREWKPSPMAAHDLAQRLSVIDDPASAFADPTPAKAETVKAVYPSLLKMAQEWLIERSGDLAHPVPYESRLRNSLLFDVPLDDSLQPDHAAILATAHAPSPVTDAAVPQPGSPQSSIATGTNLTQMYQTGHDRRAS